MQTDDRSSFDNREPDGQATTFGHLAVGDEFYFSNYARTGLLSDMNRPGTVLYVKLGARRYQRADNGQADTIGRLSAQVWKARFR